MIFVVAALESCLEALQLPLVLCKLGVAAVQKLQVVLKVLLQGQQPVQRGPLLLPELFHLQGNEPDHLTVLASLGWQVLLKCSKQPRFSIEWWSRPVSPASAQRRAGG